MTNEQREDWARWEKEGENWREIFRHIDPVLVSFAETHKLELRRWHWDAPDRTLTWSSEGLQRSLHVSIDGEPGSYSVLVEEAIWQDRWEDGNGERHWAAERLGEITQRGGTAEWVEGLADSTLQVLGNGFQRVQEWGRQQLKQTIGLTR